MPTLLYLVHIFLYLSNSIKITTNTDKSVTQSNLLGQASASYANDSLSCPHFLPHKLLPTTRTRSPSFAGRKRRRSGKQSVVCNIGSAVAFNWFLFAITGLQQLQEIGIGCISAADDFESPTRPIIFFKAQIILNRPPAWLFSLKLTDSTSLRCNTPLTTCNAIHRVDDE